MSAALEETVLDDAVLEDVGEELQAPPELLPPGIQEPVIIVDGKPELILPNDHTYFTDCAENASESWRRQRGFSDKVVLSLNWWSVLRGRSWLN
jgi:hypothetical protein